MDNTDNLLDETNLSKQNIEPDEADLSELNKELDEAMSDVEVTEHESSDHKRKSSGSHGKKRRKKKKKKKKSPFRIFMIVLIVIVVLLASLVAAFFIMKSMGEKKLQQAVQETVVEIPVETELDVQVENDGKLVVYNGEKYLYNEELITILCMGVDHSLNSVGEDSIGENGQADTVVLAVLDKNTGDLNLINISRDSMVDVNKYNVNGEYTGVEKMQLCLAYAYGDGRAKSCENMATSVSRLIYGIPINAYAAMDYSGISVMNDTVGGVTVTILEDMSNRDPELVLGNTVTLNGDQAHRYVRSRNIEVLDSNNQRMARQKQYLLALLQNCISKAKSDIGIVYTLYQNLSDYMVTDMGAPEFVYLATLVMDTGITEGNIRSVKGEVVQGETYAEFVPDEKELYELILDVFYTKQ